MKTLLFILPVMLLTTCGQSDTFKNLQQTEPQFCHKTAFQTLQEQADSLTFYMIKANESSLNERANWEQKFFCAFPNSFKEMQAMFGYDDEYGAAPLYATNNPTYHYMDNKIFSDVIGYFSSLQSIPDSTYYSKYININIDGKWEADNINEAFGFYYNLINDTKNATQGLESFTDEEIKSVFLFLFDGPHPNNEHNQEMYETLQSKIETQSKRVSELLHEAYVTKTGKESNH